MSVFTTVIAFFKTLSSFQVETIMENSRGETGGVPRASSTPQKVSFSQSCIVQKTSVSVHRLTLKLQSWVIR